jgi:uncharacterized protein (TIGR02001 family)
MEKTKMKTKLQHYAIALMMGMGFLGLNTAAQAADDISVYADIGAQSQYIWRGAAQSVNNDVAFQGDVGIEHESGLSANVWFSTGVDFATTKETEFDFTVDYSGETNDLGYSVGFISYQYTDSASSNEIYAGISKGIAALTAYYNTDSKGLYTELDAGMTVADMFDASASFGVNSPDVGSSTNHFTLGASKDFDNITANLTIGKQTNLDTEFAVGVNAAF